ncbi:MAG TPA: hypothetical protein GXZ90_09935 [Clostridiales bacterium]|nr:hypothetical protein [Clostridiales bacterium]
MAYGLNIYSIFNPRPSLAITPDDFKVTYRDSNGTWIRLEELQNMIDKGIIQVDKDKLKEFVDSWRCIDLK